MRLTKMYFTSAKRKSFFDYPDKSSILLCFPYVNYVLNFPYYKIHDIPIKNIEISILNHISTFDILQLLMMIICILWLINNVKKIVVLLFALYFWIVSGKIKRIFRIPYIFPSRIKWKINCYCNGNMPVSFVYFYILYILFIALEA